MKQWPKPTIVASACLEFEACRYNGEKLKDETIDRLKPYVNFIPICPEVEIGLGTPRPTIRIVGEEDAMRLIDPKSMTDHTAKMDNWSTAWLEALPPVDAFILKSKSPSCGMRDVKRYMYADKPASHGKGAGLFALKVKEKFPVTITEEEGRLSNYTIREHFYTALFTMARFREMKADGKTNDLVRFQSVNKYLFMAYNQQKQKDLGRIVANKDRLPRDEQWALYERTLGELLSRTPRYTSHVNVCEHIYGYYNEKLSEKEKAHYRELLADYREKRSSLRTIIALLESWALRFDQGYLEEQTYFEPFPKALVTLLDSGKGRNY
ncbi:MAG: YbgA family protein [Bacilli bacterium]